MIRTALVCLAVLTLSAPAEGQERKAYKSVDEKGNVTYSQTPPAGAKEASRIDISPANSSRGAYGGRYVAPPSSYSGERHHYESAARAQTQRVEEAQRKRMTDLEAECMRGRGTDCKDPETLRYIESQKIPRSYGRR